MQNEKKWENIFTLTNIKNKVEWSSEKANIKMYWANIEEKKMCATYEITGIDRECGNYRGIVFLLRFK